MTRPIRFGLVASGTEVHDLVATAQKAEHIGFSSIGLNDHFNSTAAPILGLQAMAAATSQIKIATAVLNQDLRHPTVLAKEAATLDLLSGGRLELDSARDGSKPTTTNPGSRSTARQRASTVSKSTSRFFAACSVLIR